MTRPVRLRIAIIVGAVLVVVLLLRETGLVSLDLSRSSAGTTITVTRTSAAKGLKATLADVTIWPSMWDYVPFYKSRTVAGEVDLPAGSSAGKGAIHCEFTVQQTVTGFCSARSFRDRIRQHVVEAINKR